MHKDLFVVVMAGGIGSRFWPASRKDFPKQFLDILNNGESLFQRTISRFSKVCPQENIFVVTNSNYKGIVKEQVPFLEDDQILLEPIGRNTAPCIAYASYKIKKKNDNAVFVVAPSDHSILDETKFIEIIEGAIDEARNSEKLITLGIKPHKPETGYGYIQYHSSEDHLKKVKTFTEKPELAMAKKFIESGDFVWNSGMFIWSLASITKAFEKYMPDVAETFIEASQSFYTNSEAEVINTIYYQFKSTSIDYGIMEKAKNVYVIPSNFGWSDLGSWSALHDISEKDEGNNVINANAITFGVKNCLIQADNKKLIVVDGLKDYIITENEDAILICPKDNEKKIKQIFNEVKKQKPEFL